MYKTYLTGFIAEKQAKMSERHLAADSLCPPLAAGTLRIYSMRYCPYAQRARMVLARNHIPHETVNIDLMSKPEWYLSKNQSGLVPTLEQDDKLVQESGICMDYLNEITPGSDLYPQDPYLKARMRLDMNKAANLISSWYKLLRGKDLEEHSTELMKQLSVVEGMIKGRFFEGDKPMMIDYYIYPWIERCGAITALTGVDILSIDKFPKLDAWFSHMVALPEVQDSFVSTESHTKFGQMFIKGKIDYDFEL